MPITDTIHTLEVKEIAKTFGNTRVVDGISFNVNPGEIFGLIGPNGAGKTTTIRMIMDIIRPDTGQIKVFDSPIDEHAKDSIGYLPEERGLYRKQSLVQSLYYIAELKGIERKRADRKADEAARPVVVVLLSNQAPYSPEYAQRRYQDHQVPGPWQRD